MTRQRRWQLRNKAKGLCSACGRIETPSGAPCASCRDRHNRLQRNRYHAHSKATVARNGFIAANGLGL